MGGSNRRRIRSEISVHVPDDEDEDLGTAARTRPLSFDEIMLKRKNRKLLEDSNNGESKEGNVPSKVTILHGCGHSVLDKHNSHSKDTAFNDMTSETKDAQRASYRRKEEKVSKRDFDNARSKNKDHQGLEIKSEHKTNKDIRRRTIEKVEEDMHHRSSEKREKDIHQRSIEKIAKDKRHRSNDIIEKDKRFRSSEKNERDERHRSNETTEKDVGYKSSQKTERDKTHRSKQNSQNDIGYKSRNGGQDCDKVKLHERLRSNPDDDGKRHHRDFPTSKDRNVSRGGVSFEKDNKKKDWSGNDVKHEDRSVMKKHEPGKRLVSEVSEREERLGSNSHHGEARSKRRRSKSPEHGKDRGRRPSSLSPRARKGDELHLDKDRSGRHHTDADRSRISNGSSGLFHRHGGSSSGLGGYSPRKRKTEAAVKTPSPPKRSPEKRNAWWDHPPSGTLGIPIPVSSAPQPLAQTKPSILVESAAAILAPSNALMSLPGLPPSTVSVAASASIDSIQLTQATRPRRRLYVDDVPPSASEKDIMDCFNSFLLSSGANHIQGTKPCISCMIHKEKSQALVEFLTPEDASAALSFDSRSFFGRFLKVRRPKDFIELANDFPEKSKAGADGISDVVRDSPHKIFVGGFSDVLPSEMLLEIVRAFGPLKAFHFELNDSVKEPCAFLEYVDHSVTVKACAALNGMKLGGRVLTVAQAFPDALLVETSEDLPSYEIPQHVKTLLEKPTEVLKIRNALDPGVVKLLSEPDLEEILEDVRQECARFGSVKSINIVKTDDNTIPETQEATHIAVSSPNLKEMDLDEQKSKVEFDTGLDESKIIHKNSPHNGDDKAGISMSGSDIKPKEEQQDDTPVADPVTAIEAVDNPVLSGEREKPDIKTEIIESNGHESASNHAVMTSVSEDVENRVGIHREGVTDKETIVGVPTEFHENKDPSSCSEPGNTDETGKLQEEKVAPALNEMSGTEADADEPSEADEKVSADHVFEPGCIFVEFRRIEASCTAAHCLHGRLFDGRAVTVEYVPRHLYSTRFAK